jgi:hypothetical protein
MGKLKGIGHAEVDRAAPARGPATGGFDGTRGQVRAANLKADPGQEQRIGPGAAVHIQDTRPRPEPSFAHRADHRSAWDG